MIVGCYTLDLYCDSGLNQPWNTKGHTGYSPGASGAFASAYPEQLTGHSQRDCEQQARACGWKLIKKYGTAICPTCLADSRYKQSQIG